MEKLVDKDGKILVNREQISRLKNLKFSDGETILSTDYFRYEVAGMLYNFGFEKVYNFLSADWEKVFDLENIQHKILFENPLLIRSKEKFILDMDIFENTVEVEAGEKCKRCGSEETMSVVSQQRSCDEISQIALICLCCKFRWKVQ